MKELTLKEYAVKNKISLFNVMKMAKSGQIPSETRTINGKEEIFILSDEAPKAETVKEDEIIDYKQAYFELKAKYDKLLKQKG
ncbi:hypothetical protein [Sulfurimonas sp. HSL3-7]|uniref:hypothetical protein n=1 Tax=Sulfonitrofixus jiaomeiensis TaxID=3131938 RepID=UPI0031F7A732